MLFAIAGRPFILMQFETGFALIVHKISILTYSHHWNDEILFLTMREMEHRKAFSWTRSPAYSLCTASVFWAFPIHADCTLYLILHPAGLTPETWLDEGSFKLESKAVVHCVSTFFHIQNQCIFTLLENGFKYVIQSHSSHDWSHECSDFNS